MGLRFAMLAATVAMVDPNVLAAQQAFPYKAYIAAHDTYVRSGPGENFYPTGKLPAGAEIEVYRHDPGGWYAIRPPEGSFSWIGRRYVKQVGDGVAEVTGERVAVRVGTELSDRRDVVQVRVTRGELLELLPYQPRVSHPSDAAWAKIAPPSGEFRWVHGSDVDLTPPSSLAGKSPSKPENASEPSKLPEPVLSSTGAKSGWSPTAASPSGNAAPAVTQASSSPPSPSQGPVAPSRPRTSQEIQKELDEINSELSLMLAQEPTTWDCEGLGRRARLLLEQAETAVDRAQARMLVQRIAQAEDVKRRALASQSEGVGGVGRRGTSNTGPLDAARPSPSTDLERFDGVGRLTRVQSARLGAPRYALVDEQGNVRAYVSPAPGVNVHSYLGRHVGVTGAREYLAEQNAEHLTAKHIVPLDARLR